MKRRDEVTVGILITVAAVVVVLGTLWLARGGLKSGYPLHTRFSWGQNLKQGQPVLLAGVAVGYVGDVNLRRDGYLEVMLRIEDQYTIPSGSKATVKPVGIFGDVAVALTPPLPIPMTSYKSGDTVPPGPSSPDMSEILTRVDSIGQSVSALTHALEAQLVAGGTLKEVHRTIVSTAALSAQLQTVVAQQNRNLSETMASFRNAALHLNSVVDSAQIQAALINVRQTSENAARLSANLDSTNTAVRKLLSQAQSGNGTVGKMLSDSLLYTDIRRLLAHADSLLADLKANPKKYINLRIF